VTKTPMSVYAGSLADSTASSHEHSYSSLG
jgi:hypothetical protein